MIKNIALFSVFLMTLWLWSPAIQAALGLGGKVDDLELKGPVVVELFTSQSCSSCPSADRVLSELSENDEVIALGCHVTYWNHLHWRDTLSKPDCTNRQHAYSAYNQFDRVYTPQMIVNGRKEFVGSYRSTAREQVEAAVPLERIGMDIVDERLVIDLPLLADGRSYALMIFGTKESHVQDVRHGENRGRTLRYSNSVLWMRSGGSWDGEQGQRVFDIGDTSRYDHLVILAQENGFGPIVAGGRIEL